MTEGQSTYSGRKIRIEGQDEELKTDSSTSKVKPKKGIMTFGEAADKGFLKTGMTVIFENCVYGPIKLEQEMTGKEQQVKCELRKGIVVKRKDEQMAIFAILRLNSDNGIILKGRYGRANGLETIKYLTNSVSEKIKNCKSSLLPIEQFVDFCKENYLALDYFKETSKNGEVVFAYDNGLLLKVSRWSLGTDRISICPGEENRIHEIGIIIDGRDFECLLKKSKAITINHLHTFKESPHEMHIEIRGVI